MDKTIISNKAIKPSLNKQIFSFPDPGISIEAESQEEAREILEKKLKGESK